MFTSNFKADVEDPRNIHAEQIAYESIVEHFKNRDVIVEDVRNQHLKWDFVIRHGCQIERVDVKHDSYIEKTNRIPFETHHIMASGRIEPTWGVHSTLHTVAIVPWSLSKVILISLPHLRTFILLNVLLHGMDELVKERGWKKWERNNVDWVTHGIAVPRLNFEAYLAHVGAGKLMELPTPSKYHRAAPRILLDGRDVRTGEEVA